MQSCVSLVGLVLQRQCRQEHNRHPLNFWDIEVVLAAANSDCYGDVTLQTVVRGSKGRSTTFTVTLQTVVRGSNGL
jgi:hypothetical protein